jgi:hypothetical protein
LALFVISAPTLIHAKKNLPTVRWTSRAPGCTFERVPDGHYRWTMSDKDLDVSLIVDSQELAKSRHRYYQVMDVYVAVVYKGSGKFEFPADLRMQFVRHHDIVEGYFDPTELQNRLQNDMDSKIFETERQIKKHPETSEQKTALLRQYQKEIAEFIEFLTTQYLEPATLNAGNPEAHGHVFFATQNKWIGPWKDREDFVLALWMKDKIWQFPFSLPPTPGDLILRQPPD